MGQGIGSEISFKIKKIAKIQSLRDVLCEAESLSKKVDELQHSLAKTSNAKKKSEISSNISILQAAAVALTGKHQEMIDCKVKTKNAKSNLIKEVCFVLLYQQ